jgi:hypothetical protein
MLHDGLRSQMLESRRLLSSMSVGQAPMFCLPSGVYESFNRRRLTHSAYCTVRRPSLSSMNDARQLQQSCHILIRELNNSALDLAFSKLRIPETMSELKEYTAEEVSKHTSEKSCWLVIGNDSNGRFCCFVCVLVGQCVKCTMVAKSRAATLYLI